MAKDFRKFFTAARHGRKRKRYCFPSASVFSSSRKTPKEVRQININLGGITFMGSTSIKSKRVFGIRLFFYSIIVIPIAFILFVSFGSMLPDFDSGQI